MSEIAISESDLQMQNVNFFYKIAKLKPEHGLEWDSKSLFIPPQVARYTLKQV